MPQTHTTNHTLPLLADPARYRACQWDLTAEHDKRAYWIGLFREQLPGLLDEAIREARENGEREEQARRRADQARDTFHAYLDRIAADPALEGRLDIIKICEARERALRDAGFDDPYRLAKARENETALEVLPRVLSQLDAMTADEREIDVVEGVFAGNIFDLGAIKTVERYQAGPIDFYATLDELKPRPWLVDDLDTWLERMQGPAHRRALLFVDNAGPDVTLGMLPLARHLLQRGTDVWLTANTTPSLNDVTHEELIALLDRATPQDAVLDQAWRDGRLRALPSGNGIPLIDLSRLAPELVAMVNEAPIDLLVLEGMGRAVESNFDAAFTCDTLKLAMIKDQGVAEALGGEVYDLVCRFEPAA